MMKKRVVILGGGFTGVKCALELAKQKRDDLRIRLVSDRPNFEYHGALYRLATGGSPLEVCLPLREIFEGYQVDVVVDRAREIDCPNTMVRGDSGSTYAYDYLVLGLGAETNYFNIPGLAEHSLGMKTITDAFKLKHHITQTLALCSSQPLQEREKSLRFVIVGAGPTGVELSGELAGYVRHLVGRHGLNPHLVTIDLIERSERILPQLNEGLARRVGEQLQSLGVSVLCNTALESLEGDTVTLSGKVIHSPTVIWTAGVRANHLIDQLGVPQDPSGQVIVNQHLQVDTYDTIFFGGDSAATQFSGMAQTAINDGRYIADCIRRRLDNPEGAFKHYAPGEPIYAIPAGPGWAGAQWGRICFFGRIGWMLRRLADLFVFINLLPFHKAWRAFRHHYHVQHHQEICAGEEK